MGTPSYMRSVVDRNVVFRRTTVFPWCIFIPCLLSPILRSATATCVPVRSDAYLVLAHSQISGRPNGYSEVYGESNVT